ncbi:MAG: ABC transporter permease [Bryobacteraceae bacterium]
MAIPISYNIRNLVVRKTTTIMTAVGIAMTVAVLLAVLALGAGLRTAFEAAGDPLHVLVLRKGGNAELTSVVSQESFQVIKSYPGIAKGPDGQPLASLEMVTIIDVVNPEEPHGGMNVTLRGVTLRGTQMRDKLKLAAGRWFTPGQREIVVGKNIAKRSPDAKLGKQLKFGKGYWTIVGIMDGGESAVNSEIFGDLNQISSDFNRPDALSSVLIQATDTSAVPALVNSMKDDRRLTVDPLTEKAYYENQTIASAPIQFLGIFVSIIMAVGSSFAAMNTMYAAVARRAKEIGTLRVLGFTKGSIQLSFLLESVVLCLIGGALGILIALPLNNVTTGIGDFITFSEISFNFKVTPMIMLIGLVFSTILGALGGLFPARQAAQKEILTALREI